MSEKGVLVSRSIAEGSSTCFWRRAHEQDLSKRHERDLGELSVVHHRETHIMLADFNKAQEVLRDKISALQILWVTPISVLSVTGFYIPEILIKTFIFFYLLSCRSVTSKLTFLIGWRARKRSWETEKADRRTSMWSRSSERWSVKGRLSSKSWWWVERQPPPPPGTPTASSVRHINAILFQDDKKFYQLELVNRETGFSKVFNSSANVGVINPLIKVSGLQPRSWGDAACFYHPLKSFNAKVVLWRLQQESWISS